MSFRPLAASRRRAATVSRSTAPSVANAPPYSAATARNRTGSAALRRGPGREDDADRPIVPHVVPGPGCERADAVAESDQVVDVDEEPGQPSEEAGEFQSAREMRHPGVAADRRHGA